MSNSLQTAALLDAIRAGVLAAWPGTSISYGRPRTKLAAPYCVISAESVAIGFGGPVSTVGNTSQTNRFKIRGRFPFPPLSSQNIELEKVVLANQLIAELQASPNFACGVFPIVSAVDFSEPDNPNEKVFELTATFEVVTQASFV